MRKFYQFQDFELWITRASPELDYVYSTRISSHSSLRNKNPRENTSVSLYNGWIIKINFTSDPFQNVAPVTLAAGL